MWVMYWNSTRAVNACFLNYSNKTGLQLYNSHYLVNKTLFKRWGSNNSIINIKWRLIYKLKIMLSLHNVIK